MNSNTHSSDNQMQNNQENNTELSTYSNKIKTSVSPTTSNGSVSNTRSSSRDSSLAYDSNNEVFNRIDEDVVSARDNISNHNLMDNSRSSSNSSDDGDGSNSCITNKQHLLPTSNDINLYNQHHHHHHHHHHQRQQNQSLNEEHQPSEKDFEQVKQVELFGISIVALTINGKERLCLAQISNTLLKEFSYNEIHNRRVALGITCVQCTPIQLEMLRRAGAMPSSSRRCGMITRREAERLCRSFLVEEQPPELPENFHFTVAHRVNYGCKGRFIPARYISSRAKCIECFYCGEFYSPNKFIFHSHRQPHATDCNPPDSPNINSWRKHIDLDWTQEHSQDIKYAWEDVKSLFNGGTRRRAPNWQNVESNHTTTLVNNNSPSSSSSKSGSRKMESSEQHSLFKVPHVDESEQLIDVECDDQSNNLTMKNNNHLSSKISTTDLSQFNSTHQGTLTTILDDSLVKFNKLEDNKLIKPNKLQNKFVNSSTSPAPSSSTNQQHRQYNRQQSSRVHIVPPNVTKYPNQSGGTNLSRHHNLKRNLNSSGLSLQNMGNTKRQACNSNVRQQPDNYLNSTTTSNSNNQSQTINSGTNNILQMPNFSTFPTTFSSSHHKTQQPFCDFLATDSAPPPLQPSLASSSLVVLPQSTNATQNNQTNLSLETEKTLSQSSVLNQMASSYPATNFIYNQLYSQLMQNQRQQQQPNKQEPIHFQQHPSQLSGASLEAQIALRHHLWSSLIANLQCNASGQIYNSQQQADLNSSVGGHCNSNLNKDLLTDINNSNFDHHGHQNSRTDLPLKFQRQQINNQTNPNPLEVYNSKANVVIQNLQFSPKTKTFPSSGESTTTNGDLI